MTAAISFLKRLADTRGAIVSSADCSPMELAHARADNRFFVDADGLGYVYRTKGWRELAEKEIERSQYNQ